MALEPSSQEAAGFIILKVCLWEFSGSPVVRLRASAAGGTGSIPGRGTNIPHAPWRGQKNKSMSNKKLI